MIYLWGKKQYTHAHIPASRFFFSPFPFSCSPSSSCAGPLAAWPVFQVHSPGDAGPYKGGIPVPPGAVSQVQPQYRTAHATRARDIGRAAHALYMLKCPDGIYRYEVRNVNASHSSFYSIKNRILTHGMALLHEGIYESALTKT